MDVEKVYRQLWELMLSRIHQKVNVEGVTQSALAAQIEVTQPTINRWLKGDRGRNVELRTVIAICIKLGVSMDDLVRAVGEENLATILTYFIENKEVASRFAAILGDANEGKRKIESEIDFIYSRISK